ncbi:hypothetical protein [Alicyclobacillus acidoterrestris]|uniref:Uncharacterized protein n=1 Tax=Alicyclobacillus acidoterrestris (strain ATCC 49025 / DSM 3922 / CIP 106132 / NCIMB 13137 / GD3B) TaxID=1356854 RepID=T0DFU8_ALIAG|nr:hypothetical protein [Alicyclobacillus acidoterrestris]EPZ50207.1 hypothetical protein N007_21145 [Alicyclobacillus acidoterrestris ATCC 49025]UNO48733.1 hypothetical protein K1I37_19115 [Alicyclobacillus acidoterrestris]
MNLGWKNTVVLVLGFAIGFAVYSAYTHQFNTSLFLGMAIAIFFGVLSEVISTLRAIRTKVPTVDERTVENCRKVGFVIIFVLLFAIPAVGMMVAMVIGYPSISIPIAFGYLLFSMVVLSIGLHWALKH